MESPREETSTMRSLLSAASRWSSCCTRGGKRYRLSERVMRRAEQGEGGNVIRDGVDPRDSGAHSRRREAFQREATPAAGEARRRREESVDDETPCKSHATTAFSSLYLSFALRTQ